MRSVGVDVVLPAAEVVALVVAGRYCIEDPSCTLSEIRPPRITQHKAGVVFYAFVLSVGIVD